MAPAQKESTNLSLDPNVWTLFLFCTVNLIAGTINHIDDTDETFGYYEPLHYALYGVGMQTWEYSPDYAIRAYSFLSPIVILGQVLKAAGFQKSTVFKSIRFFLGVMTAFSQTLFIESIRKNFGAMTAVNRYTIWFLVFSPGVFYCSTALLPSACIMPILMVSIASYLHSNFISSIFWGSVAVLWSGWPFVGVILFPIGVHMMAEKINSHGYFGLLLFIIKAGLTVTIVGIPTIAIDSWLYGKLTWPALNIFMYNVGSGSGDELYGVEPASYYIKNLLLNAGVIAFPLAMIAPALCFAESMLSPARRSDSSKVFPKTITLYACMALWLTLLFRRPHKEERFLYPIYPLSSILAAITVDSCSKIVDIFQSESEGYKQISIPKMLKVAVIGGSLIISSLFGLSRTISNYKNFGGYMATWLQLQQYLMNNESSGKSLNICVGGEWYQFPSHFLMPENARLRFVNDTFHGLLPHYFTPELTGNRTTKFDFAFVQGTRAHTGDRFNDKNREDPRRYIFPVNCDYIVLSVPAASRGDVNYKSETPLRQFIRGANDEPTLKGAKLLSRDVLDSESSHSAFARAFYLPILTRSNVYKKYTVYSFTNRVQNS